MPLHLIPNSGCLAYLPFYQTAHAWYPPLSCCVRFGPRACSSIIIACFSCATTLDRASQPLHVLFKSRAWICTIYLDILHLWISWLDACMRLTCKVVGCRSCSARAHCPQLAQDHHLGGELGEDRTEYSGHRHFWLCFVSAFMLCNAPVICVGPALYFLCCTDSAVC